MGIEASTLGKSYRKALKAEKKAGREPLDSNLEARFVYYLKELKVPRWQTHQQIAPLGTRHTADFLWLDCPSKQQRLNRRDLAIFIDGPVHGLKGRLAETMAIVNLCALLPITWTVFHFTDTQLEMGAECVWMWHQGELVTLFERLQRTK